MTKLTELSPEFFGEGYPGEPFEPKRHGTGIIFQCPCSYPNPCSISIMVPFENPIDGGAHTKLGLGQDRNSWWKRTGDTFETLTLHPSIDIKLWDEASGKLKSHWHGYIKNGEATKA